MTTEEVKQQIERVKLSLAIDPVEILVAYFESEVILAKLVDHDLTEIERFSAKSGWREFIRGGT